MQAIYSIFKEEDQEDERWRTEGIIVGNYIIKKYPNICSPIFP